MADPASIRYWNPGAMWPGPSSDLFGSKESIKLRDGNKIAVFPDAESGAAAQFDLLGRKYSGMRLADAIAKWSGGNHSLPYTRHVAVNTGLTPETVLTPDLLRDPTKAVPIARAMAAWEAGRRDPAGRLAPYPMSDEQWAKAHGMYLGAVPGKPSPVPYDMYGETVTPASASPPTRPPSAPPPAAPMATYDGDTPEQVAYSRKLAQQLTGQAMEGKPRHWLEALGNLSLGASGSLWSDRARTSEMSGKTAGDVALRSALMSSNPTAAIAASMAPGANPYVSERMGPLAGSILTARLTNEVKQNDPLYKQQVEAATKENILRQRNIDAPPLVKGVTKDGEIPNVFDPRTGKYTFSTPPGFVTPAEKVRAEERAKLEEKTRAAALEKAQEAEEMTRQVRNLRTHLGPGADKGKYGPNKQYGVDPNIFGPVEASTANDWFTSAVPGAVNAIRGAVTGSDPMERLRQRQVIQSRFQELQAAITSAANKGQGAVSNFERDMYAKAIGTLQSGDIEGALRQLDDLALRFEQKAAAEREPYRSDTRPSLVPPPGGASPASIGRGVVAPPVSVPGTVLSPPPAGPGAVLAPPPPASAASPPPRSAAPPPSGPTPGSVSFDSLSKNDQREAIMRMAKYPSPETEKNFERTFGTEALNKVKAQVEKLKKSIAF